MNESEKREIEYRDCGHFLDAYEFATGQEFDAKIQKSESPDFVCTRCDGSIFGVELTRLFEDKPVALVVFSNYDTMDSSAEKIVGEIFRLAEEKGDKIRKPGSKWKTKENILVFQLYNLGLSDLGPSLNSYRGSIAETLGDLPIAEVWIADFVGEHGDSVKEKDALNLNRNRDYAPNSEAHDAVNLFGLYPEKYWGLHVNPNTERKPYG